MEATRRTYDYLRSLDSVFVESKIIVDAGSYNSNDSTVYVNRLDLYRKRNGKICYVDHKGKRVHVDPEKVKRYRNSTFIGAHEDWGKVVYHTNYKIDKSEIERIRNNPQP